MQPVCIDSLVRQQGRDADRAHRAQQQHGTLGLRAQHRLQRDQARGTGAVFDQHGITVGGQAVGDHARDMVRTPACGIAHHQVSQFRGRHTAGPRYAARCRQQASRGKAQPLPARPWQSGKARFGSGWTMARKSTRATRRLRRGVPRVALRLGLRHAEGAIP